MRRLNVIAVARDISSQKDRPKSIGYVRVSTDEQTTALQRDALAACDQIYEDVASGGTRERPALAEALGELRAGDTLVVWRLDRLGRSLGHLIEISDELRSRDIFLRSVNDGIDTSTAAGRLIYHVLGAVAQFERETIVERTRAGMAAAKKRGVHVGRRRALKPAQLDEIQKMLGRDEDRKSIAEVARLFRVSRPTLYRELSRMQ